MDEEEAGFRAEYAKSDRSTCKGCRSGINKDTLRLAIMVQSPNFDGKIPTWYHMNCFFKKVKPADAQIIKGFDDLRWDDQETIRNKLEGKSANQLTQKSSNEQESSSMYTVEYARSNRSTCQGCNEKIEKNLVRLSKKATVDGSYVPQDQWYHIDCFKSNKDSIQFDGNAETFSGFDQLNKEDQTELKKKFGSTTANRKRKNDKTTSSTTENDDAPKAKVSKIEDQTDSNNQQDEIKLKKVRFSFVLKIYFHFFFFKGTK